MVDGPFGSNLKTEHYTTERQVRIIQLSNIGEAGWNNANVKYTTFSHAAELQRCIVQPGSILIAKMMPAGRAIICPDNEKSYILGSDVVKVVPNSSVDSRYLVYATKSQFYLDQIADDTQGSTRARTSVSKLRKTAILFPEKDEQIANPARESLEYVILHELAHLKVKSHGPEFVAILNQYMPQWQERKKLLNESKLDYMDSDFEE